MPHVHVWWHTHITHTHMQCQQTHRIPAHSYKNPRAPTHTHMLLIFPHTHVVSPHTHSSGPHKLDVRLLLYRRCRRVESFYSSGAKQLICGFSVVLLGSSSAENDPVITCQISRLWGRQLSFGKTKHDFSTRWQAFSPGDVKKRPLLLQWATPEYKILVIFREESSGIGRFYRLEFQRMANWPSFDKKIETGRIIRSTKQAACFVQFTLFRLKKRNWACWPSVGTSSLQNRPIPLDSSRKLTNSSLRQQGTFFNVPGRKSLPKCWKFLLCFLER